MCMCDMFIFCLELYNYCVLIITYLLLYAANYGELVATVGLAYSLATAYINSFSTSHGYTLTFILCSGSVWLGKV